MSDRNFSKETLERWDDEYVWHPFTPHSVYRDEQPLTVVAGDGHYLIDADGRRYLDAVGSIWCNLFGHRRREIDDAVREQLDHIAHSTLLGNTNDRPVLLAKRLLEWAPDNLGKVFYSDNGSTSVEIAMKMALQFWQQHDGGSQRQRTTFMGLANAYSGDTIGAVSIGGIDLFHARFGPMLFEAVRGPSPVTYHRLDDLTRKQAEEKFVAHFDEVLEKHADELAALVIEPGMQGAGGMVTYPDGFLAHAAQKVRDAGALLIVDEVAMGMGRSGRMFACQREGVDPDFLCVAKGLTGGYVPVAATLTTNRIYEAFLGPPEEGRTFFHGHTYTGNALGCAAALATLDIFEKEDVLPEVRRKEQVLAAHLESLWDHPNVGDIRQYGLAAGVELVAHRDTRETFDSTRRIGMKVCSAARDKGVFLRPLGDVIVLMPPLSITDDELKTLVEAIRYGIETVLDT